MKRLAAVLVLATASAGAWEPDSTHAGLTEGAALATNLHRTLVAAHGRRLGWYETLAVPPASAAALYAKLAALPPSSGLVPDKNGRLSALGWLVAGSVIEDLPAGRARNHFFDPLHKTGLDDEHVGGFGAALSMRLWAAAVKEPATESGLAATDWVVSPKNDLDLARFWDELEASAVAATPAERDQHLAFALLCAGAMSNVLEDMGSPSHVRDDWAEHMLPLGGGPGDRGSRFERLAALVYGRLGVPAPAPAELRAHLRDFFTSADGKGLADITNKHWYSSGTLPDAVPVPERPSRGEVVGAAVATQRYAQPRPGVELNLSVADSGVASLRDDHGVCLANYHVDHDRLVWFIGDDCAAEQLQAILPVVGGYTQGLLEWLFRGVVPVTVDAGVAKVRSPGAGTVRFLGEDQQGRRWLIDSRPAVTDEDLTFPVGTSLPAVRVIAVFRGKDAAGEELVGVGQAIVVTPSN